MNDSHWVFLLCSVFFSQPVSSDSTVFWREEKKLGLRCRAVCVRPTNAEWSRVLRVETLGGQGGFTEDPYYRVKISLSLHFRIEHAFPMLLICSHTA